MPRVHVETAIGQFTGTRTLLATELERALDARSRRCAPRSSPSATRAIEAIDAHIDWLRSQARRQRRPATRGSAPEMFARKLALTLDTASDADAVLARAESDLARVEERIAETAARPRPGGPASGQVRRVLDRLAADGEVADDDTIVGLCEQALQQTDRVRPSSTTWSPSTTTRSRSS